MVGAAEGRAWSVSTGIWVTNDCSVSIGRAVARDWAVSARPCAWLNGWVTALQARMKRTRTTKARYFRYFGMGTPLERNHNPNWKSGKRTLRTTIPGLIENRNGISGQPGLQ